MAENQKKTPPRTLNGSHPISRSLVSVFLLLYVCKTNMRLTACYGWDGWVAENNNEATGGKTRVSGCRPSKHLLSYHSAARPGSFQARDNISQFIGWARSTLAVPDTLLFETEDLVSRRNERNVLLCLLEVLPVPACTCFYTVNR